MANGEIIITLAGDGQQLRGTLRGATVDAEGLAGVAQKLQRNWLAVGSAIAATEGARRILNGLVNAASDQVEAQNKVNVVFGNSAAVINRFAATSARDLGISETAALDAAGAYGNMFTTIGLGGPEMAEMSVRLTQLAADMASFNNADPSEMLDKLRAGLAGEAEPLRTAGVLLSEARVKTEAYASGIAEAGAVLTEAQKVQARYNLILQDTAVQHGDVERSAGTLATEQRKLSAQWADLQAQVGGPLSTALAGLVGELNDVLAGTGRVQEDLDTLASFPPIEIVVNFVRKVGGIDVPGGGSIMDAIMRGVGTALPIVAAEKMAYDYLTGGGEDPNIAHVNDPGVQGLAPRTPWGYVPGPGGFQGTPIVPSPIAEGGGMMEHMARLTESFRQVSLSGRDAGNSSREVADAQRELARIQEQIVAENTAELVQAYYEGGAKQVEIVRASQLEQEAEWAKVAEGMHDVLGVELPEEFRGMWERYLEVQQEGIDAAIEEEQRLRNERAQNAARGYIAILEAHARAGLPFTGSIEDFDFDLGRTNLTPDEQFLSGQTPIVLNATLQLSNGQEGDIYVLGQEYARSVGLEPYVGPRA